MSNPLYFIKNFNTKFSASNNNARRALLLLEISKVNQDYTKISEYDWILHLRETASLIGQSQSAETVLSVRQRIQYLIHLMIPVSEIFREFRKNLQLYCREKDSLKIQLALLCADFEHRAVLGINPMVHLEPFFIEFMVLLAEDEIGADQIESKEVLDRSFNETSISELGI